MKSEIKSLLKRVLPENAIQTIRFAYRPVSHIRFKLTLRQVRRNHKKEIERLRNKDRIKVVFFLIEASVWKVDGVFRLMLESKRFDPVVVICPYVKYGHDVMMETMDRAEEFVKSKGYPYVRTFNEKNNTWLDVRKELTPDIVFFTNPFTGLTKKEYTIYNYTDSLTCYVPYGFKNSNLYNYHFNQPIQNFVWKFFLETAIHKKLAKIFARNKGKNAVVTGYPGMDSLLIKKQPNDDVWKIKDLGVKKLIWAPHHTIPGYGATLDYSTFLIYCEAMFVLAEKHKDKLQIAFKPHPILRSKLSLPEVWGKSKTDEYYEKWATLENGQLNESGYIDLFTTSDGMIHDSSSFVIEYLYTSKPVMFLINDDGVKENFNEIGKRALDVLYLGRGFQDVENFVRYVILKNNDHKLNDREEFFHSLIKPPNNLTASENIINHIKGELSFD